MLVGVQSAVLKPAASSRACSIGTQLCSAHSWAPSVPHCVASGQGCLGLWTPHEVGQEDSTGVAAGEQSKPVG